MKEKRRTRMGIVTNKMSDEVYNHLEAKAENNEFSQYIIHLVEMDIERQNMKDDFHFIKHELQDLYDKINDAKAIFQREEKPVVYSEHGGTLVNLNIVSDEKVNKAGLDESVDLDF